MNISFSRQLNDHQKKALQTLVGLCRQQDQFRLSCQWTGICFI